MEKKEKAVLIKSLTVGPFGVNCFIIACEETREAMIIDPGDDSSRILYSIEEEQLNVKYIVNTHCHIDHVGAVEQMRKATDAPYYIHKDEEPLLDHISQQALMFGLRPFTVNKPEGYLHDGQSISLGKETLTVLVTPGHSPGSVSLAGQGVVFVGDLIFAGSVGRTDLHGGSFPVLKDSIMKKIVPLGKETRIYCGHGPDTTVGRELEYNPFLSDSFVM